MALTLTLAALLAACGEKDDDGEDLTAAAGPDAAPMWIDADTADTAGELMDTAATWDDEADTTTFTTDEDTWDDALLDAPVPQGILDARRRALQPGTPQAATAQRRR